MIRKSSYTVVVQLVVSTVVLAIFVQSLLVIGLVTPVYVAGSSMAPTLVGPSVLAQCPQCAAQLTVGAEFAAETPFATCDHCGNRRVPLAGLAVQNASRLFIDRTAFDRRGPRPGEVAVVQNPVDGSEWSVKRVVGLPGETVAIRQGDIWIDGRPRVKSLDQQRAVRQLVALEREVITDDVSYNAGLSRRSNPVRDFMVSLELKVRGKGVLDLELNDGFEPLKVTIHAPSGNLTARADDAVLAETMLSANSRRLLDGEIVLVELSNFDRQLLLAIDSLVELACPLDVDAPPPRGTVRPFRLATSGLKAQTWNLSLYRDVYYCRQTVDRPVGPDQVALGDDEYYLLGDNSPISVDSRSWGGVPRRFLIGRVLGIR